jgi:hypothetical protein
MVKFQIDIPDWGVRDYTKKVKLHKALVREYFKILYFEMFVFGKLGEIWGKIAEENPQLKQQVWEKAKTIEATHDEDKVNFDTGLGKFYAARYTAKHSAFKYSKEIMDLIEEKIVSHRTNNLHHLEAYKGLIIRLPNEKPVTREEIQSSTPIQYLDLMEMAADWLASGEEDGADPETWFRAQFEYGSFKITYKCAQAMNHMLQIAHPFLEENCKLQRFGNNPTELNYGKQERNIRKVG